MRIRILPVAIVLISVMFCCFSVSAADFYQPAEAIQIISEVSGGAEAYPGTKQRIEWVVIPGKDKYGSAVLSFYRKGSGKMICGIRFSGTGSGIIWEGPGNAPQMIRDDNLFILPGFPVPCDALPVAQLLSGQDGSRVYEVKRAAGGRRFVDRLQVDCIPVDGADAVKKGWLKADVVPGAGLKMIRAVNLRTHEVMVQQLWAPDASWWIYEQTPYRRSWRVR